MNKTIALLGVGLLCAGCTTTASTDIAVKAVETTLQEVKAKQEVLTQLLPEECRTEVVKTQISAIEAEMDSLEQKIQEIRPRCAIDVQVEKSKGLSRLGIGILVALVLGFALGFKAKS